MNIRVLYILRVSTFAICLMAGSASKAIETEKNQYLFNQAGYHPEAKKLALIQIENNDKADNQNFQIVDKTGKKLYSGNITEPVFWKYSNSHFLSFDFSSLSSLGTYKISSPYGESSWFKIKPNPFEKTSSTALKAFYLNRASIEIKKEFAGQYARPLAHPDDNILVYQADKKDSTLKTITASKGWYDAGDFNKYVVNASISVYLLLAAYQHCSSCFDDNSHIPESDNDRPDILDETLWELEWLLAMQDPSDGGVYHKLSSKNFQGYIMPHESKASRYVLSKTTSATLDFAAVMAVASRVYKPFEKDLSKQFLNASVQAWNWAIQNPDLDYQQPREFNTGTYAHENETFADEWFWAAVELTTSTQQTHWLEMVELQESGAIPTWAYVTPLAWISTNLWADQMPQEALVNAAKVTLLKTADFLVGNMNALETTIGAYEHALTDGQNDADFDWGSNSVIASHAIILLNAYLITHSRHYLDAAIGNLDYLHGKNPLNKSFITGIGNHSPKDIHHRASIADGIEDPIPGLLVGGPQPHQHDKDDCAPVKYPSKFAALSYIDHHCSWASNEVAINWNAALVYAATISNHYLNQIGEQSSN